VQLSSTQHPSLSPSDMVSKPTQSHSLTSHAYKSALTQPPLSQPRLHLTLGHSHKTATSFTTRDCSMSPTIRTFDWTSCAPTTTIVWQDTPASPRPSRIYVASYTGHEWSCSSLTTSSRVLSAVAASPSITSPFVGKDVALMTEGLATLAHQITIHSVALDKHRLIGDAGRECRSSHLRKSPPPNVLLALSPMPPCQAHARCRWPAKPLEGVALV